MHIFVLFVCQFILEALVWFSLFISDGFHLVRVFVLIYFAFFPNCAGIIFIVDSVVFFFILHAHTNIFPYSHFQKKKKKNNKKKTKQKKPAT